MVTPPQTSEVVDMKLPEKIRIGAFEYDLSIVDELRDTDDNKMNGQISYNDTWIKISSKQSEQTTYTTLWHEALHGIIHHSGNAIEHKEITIEMFANGIVQVIKDNPWIVNLQIKGDLDGKAME